VDVYALSLKLQAAGQADVTKALQSVGKSMNVTAGIAKAAGAAIGTAFVGTMALIAKNSMDAERVMSQLNATIKSTGGAAGFSADQVAAMATDLQKVSTFGDEAIVSMQSVLMTFTKVKGDEFKGASAAILDMATALEMDLKGAALQVGKALNDPIAGVSALGRAGVQFTAAQKETIAALVQTGQTAEAQRIILKELETQFGGSARAARNTLGGALKALNNAFGDLWEVPGILAPITAEINKLTEFLSRPETIAGVKAFAQGAVTAFLVLGETVVDVVGVVATSASQINAVLGKIPVLGMGWKKMAGVTEGVAEWAATASVKFSSLAVAVASAGTEIKKTAGVAARSLEESVERMGGPTVRDLGVTFTPPEMGDMWADFRKMMEDRAKASERKGRKLELTVPIEPKFDVGQFADIFQRLQQEGDELYAALEAWSSSVANSIVDAFAMSLERAAASGRLSEGWKALGAGLLGGLGTVLVDFGKKSMMASTLMKQILDGIGRFMPQASFAAGLALVALGSAMRGTASNATVFGSGRGGGGGVGFAGAGGMRFDDTFTRVTYGPTNANVAAGMEPRRAMNITVIGPNDPQAQRQIQELISKGARR
jgi:hypothetical protein